MKDKILSKALIIGVICVLMLLTIAIASTESNSNYNLKVKIRNTHLVYNSTTNLRFSVNVSNKGPDTSANYSIKVEVISKPSQHYFLPYNPLQDLVKEITSYLRF